MAKYKTEFKMKVVKEYLEGNVSYKYLAKKYSIPDKSNVRRWVNAYESQGYDGLKVSRTNNNYSLDFKLNVVNLYLTGEIKDLMGLNQKREEDLQICQTKIKIKI